MAIIYVNGDATDPSAVAVGTNKFVIAHVVNSAGGWGCGFVVSLSKRWKSPELQYRELAKNDGLQLGEVQFVECNDNTVVANMVAQDGYARNGEPPIRYKALKACLNKVRQYAHDNGASVHMPRIGCGLAGGKWSEIEPIIEEALDGIDVYVYDFVSKDPMVSIKWNK
jgi:O-acetyl-ADP-ribose deacetylase (regulator of RNase III)